MDDVNDRDLTSVTEITRDLAYRQLDAQLQASDNYDAKTGGVLAFDGAAIAAILAAKDVFHGWWGIPAVGVLLSAGLAVGALWNRAYDVGPEVEPFYDRVKRSTSAEANVALVSEMTGSLRRNDRTLKNKSRFFLGSLAVVVLTGAASAVSYGQSDERTTSGETRIQTRGPTRAAQDHETGTASSRTHTRRKAERGDRKEGLVGRAPIRYAVGDSTAEVPEVLP